VAAVVDLLVLNGSRAGARFALPDVPTVLGRSPEAHLRVDDPWISNMHALFEARGDTLWVVDLGSRNGTFVGEERVEEAQVGVGAVLAFGGYVLSVV
jgi:pSer/pThr/pTyr-binding forkhead associated (FHA) protein